MLISLAMPAPLFGQVGAAQDEYERYFHATFFLGGGWPVGSMNVDFDPGLIGGARGEYALSPMTRVGAQIAFYSFDAEPVAELVDNEGVINMSLIGKAIGTWGPYEPFALIGLGAYVTKDQVAEGRRWDGGLELGGGLGLEVSEHFSVLVGTSFHMVFRGGGNIDYLWLDGYLGFDFKQP